MAKSARDLLFHDPNTVKLEILNTSIDKLGLNLATNGLTYFQHKLFREFERIGIKYFRPRIYLSNETGCDDFSGDIGILFIEGHEILESIYEKIFGIRPTKEDGLIWTFRHEAGHSFMWRFGIRRSREFTRLFGKLDRPYGGWKAYNHSEYITNNSHFVSGYGQTHPIEDFAETFRAYLEGNWRTKYWRGARKKLEFAKRMIEKYGHKRSGAPTGEFYLPLEKITSTVAEFFETPLARSFNEWNKKDTIKTLKVVREQWKRKASGYMDDDLLSIFPRKRDLTSQQLERYLTVKDWLVKYPNRLEELADRIAFWTGGELPVARDLLEKFSIRADLLDLSFNKRQERKVFAELATYFTALMMNYLHRGRFNVQERN